jgi:hypothetical protein
MGRSLLDAVRLDAKKRFDCGQRDDATDRANLRLVLRLGLGLLLLHRLLLHRHTRDGHPPRAAPWPVRPRDRCGCRLRMPKVQAFRPFLGQLAIREGLCGERFFCAGSAASAAMRSNWRIVGT